MDTIAHAEAKGSEKAMIIAEELQEMIDEVDCDGEGEVNEKEFLRITALRAPRPTASLTVRSPPNKGCTPPNLLAGHSEADHLPSALKGLGVSFGEDPRSPSTEPCRPRIAFAGWCNSSTVSALLIVRTGEREQAGLEKARPPSPRWHP